MKLTTLNVAGLEEALKGMRNPLNSWEKSDSCLTQELGFVVGENDMNLAQRLVKAGAEHCKYRRMVQVWVDIDMPRYWWSEFDTYKVGTTANSCSTMHKLLNNTQPITMDLFVVCEEDLDIAQLIVERLEMLRQIYLAGGKKDHRLLVRAKRLLMEGFLQLRTVNLNYETISKMYHQRKSHRLKEEWQETFCRWVESLPYAAELIM